MITKLLFAHIGFSNIVCVNKVKAVKRQMYGRASFTLLRKRIILHPA